MPTAKPSARAAQSERVRNALLKSCADLLYQKPLDAITINEIVDHAGVGKGSFYNHFSDKEALQATISATILAEVEQEVRRNNENVDDPAYRITRGMCTHIRMALANPRRATIMMRGHEWATSNHHDLYRNVHHDIAQGITSGRFAERCDKVGALLVIGTVYFCMLRILDRNSSQRTAADLTARTVVLTLCGFGIEESEATIIASTSAKEILRR